MKPFITKQNDGQKVSITRNPPLAEFAGDARRWARRRTRVLQVPTNKADPVKSASLKGQKN